MLTLNPGGGEGDCGKQKTPPKKREKKGDVETLREGQICAENLFQVARNLPFLKKHVLPQRQRGAWQVV